MKSVIATTLVKPDLLKAAEIGILHVIEQSAVNGIFHETAEKMSERIDCHPRSIQLYIRRLVTKGLLTEIEPRHQDAKGWWVPATYRLNPAKESATVQRKKQHMDSSERNSTSPANLITLDNPPAKETAYGVLKDLTPAKDFALEANTGQRIEHMSDDREVVSGTGANLSLVWVSCSDPDCTNEVLLGTTACYRHQPDHQPEIVVTEITVTPKTELPPYEYEFIYPERGFDEDRVPKCEQCRRETVDWDVQPRGVFIRRFCGQECEGNADIRKELQKKRDAERATRQPDYSFNQVIAIDAFDECRLPNCEMCNGAYDEETEESGVVDYIETLESVKILSVCQKAKCRAEHANMVAGQIEYADTEHCQDAAIA